MGIEEEIMLGAEDDMREIAFIQNYLPQELKEKFSEDELYYFLDLIIDYYTENNVFDAEPDEEGYVEIDLDAVVGYVVKQAKKEKMGTYEPDDILMVVQAELAYSEQQEEE